MFLITVSKNLIELDIHILSGYLAGYLRYAYNMVTMSSYAQEKYFVTVADSGFLAIRDLGVDIYGLSTRSIACNPYSVYITAIKKQLKLLPSKQ